jgi:rhodanese-related sulfurtransferase
MKKHICFILLLTMLSALVGAAATYSVLLVRTPSQNELIKDFYDIENAVYASPHSVRKNIGKGDESFILVDLRSQQEYETEHIVGAINIPAYKDPDTSAYGDVDRIVAAFAALPEDKDIIVYCYSMPCMTGRKIGKMLAEHDIYVKHLGIGWNEWRYYWDLWNHDGERQVNASDYIVSGSKPGTIAGSKNMTGCPAGGSLGC